MIFCLVGVVATMGRVAYGRERRALVKRFGALGIQALLARNGAQERLDWFENFSQSISRWVAKRMPQPDHSSAQGEHLARRLLQAGYFKPSNIRTFWMVRLGLAAGMAILGLLSTWIAGCAANRMLLSVLVGGASGYAAPGYYIGRRGAKRQAQIARQLADTLDLLIVCVEAGLSLFEAIKTVATETAHRGLVIGEELAFVSAEIAVGATLGEALRGLAERTAVEEIRPLAATLIQSEQLGAQIAPALRASSDALRARRQLRAEEAAQKTAIKMLLPLVLFVLPAMIAVIMGPAFIQIIHTMTR
jgi:tight adherence protein C